MKELKISTETLPHTIILTLSGHLDVNTFETLDHKITNLIHKYYYFLLDFKDMIGISSAGAGTLLSLSNKLSEKKGAMIIYNLPENIHNTLQILGLICKDKFELYHLTTANNKEQALEIIKKRKS